MNKSILIIDDDKDFLISLKRTLSVKGIEEEIFIASNEEEGKNIFLKEKPLVVILDLELNPKIGVDSGYNLLKALLKEDNTAKIIVLTGHGSSEYGINAIKYGASNFLKKPTDTDHLIALIKDGIEQSILLKEYNKLKNKNSDKNILENYVIGKSDAIKKIRDDILFLGQTRQPVLIEGETGTGKGLIAKAIHLFGKNVKAPFVRYQPNFANDDLTNSDLFGYEKGAFTGALQQKQGLLTQAGNGTFFLDECASLSEHTQVALLTVLQEGKLRKVGGTKEEDVNFRLITATNEDTSKLLEEKKMRLDFFHRISHSKITILPLRKRKEDIEPLSLFFLEELLKKEDFVITDIDKKAINKLKDHEWKGNIRELQAVIEHGAYKASYANKRVIEESDIILNATQEKTEFPYEDSSLSFQEKVLNYKKHLVQNALNEAKGNQQEAAKILGLNRTTLLRIMKS